MQISLTTVLHALGRTGSFCGTALLFQLAPECALLYDVAGQTEQTATLLACTSTTTDAAFTYAC